MLKKIGILDSASADSRVEELAAFDDGLRKQDYVVGKNVTIEYRSANSEYGRLRELAEELVRRRVDVLVAAGGPVSAKWLKQATETIPIVFTTIDDPRKSGLVTNLQRPEGNLTGTWGLTSELDRVRLKLLHELTPHGKAIGVLVNPNRPNVDDQKRDVEAAAKDLDRQVVFQGAGSDQDIKAANSLKGKVAGLLVAADPLFNSLRTEVVELAAHLGVPAIYQWRGFTAAGGLMSYGPRIADAYRQTGVYVGRILNGARVADLPVVKPTVFELVINRETENTLGRSIPASLLELAAEGAWLEPLGLEKAKFVTISTEHSERR